MASNRVYSPAEICEMFGISKSTLFRWEREPWFPRVSRDLSGHRRYTQEHVRVISRRQTEQLAGQFARVVETEDSTALMELVETISLYKFLQGDMTGLRELAEYAQLPPKIILHLLRIAMEQYEPGEEIFCEIARAVWEQSCKLSHEKTLSEGSES